MHAYMYSIRKLTHYTKVREKPKYKHEENKNLQFIWIATITKIAKSKTIPKIGALKVLRSNYAHEFIFEILFFIHEFSFTEVTIIDLRSTFFTRDDEVTHASRT